MVEAINKNQYSKFKENECSIRDILKLEEIQDLDKTILYICTFLETYDLLFLFIIVCPVNSKLCKCTLKTRDGKAITYDLLTVYRLVTPKTVKLSTTWYNKYGYLIGAQNDKQTLSCDMIWSLLHYKHYVQASLHTDVDLLLKYNIFHFNGEVHFTSLF